MQEAVAGLDPFGVADLLTVDLDAHLVDLDEPADVVGIWHDLVVIDQPVVADVPQQLAFDRAPSIGRAAECTVGQRAGWHEIAVKGPGLDDHRRPRARMAIVQVVPHLLAPGHDRQRSVFGLFLGQAAQVCPLVWRDVPFHLANPLPRCTRIDAVYGYSTPERISVRLS